MNRYTISLALSYALLACADSPPMTEVPPAPARTTPLLGDITIAVGALASTAACDGCTTRLVADTELDVATLLLVDRDGTELCRVVVNEIDQAIVLDTCGLGPAVGK